MIFFKFEIVDRRFLVLHIRLIKLYIVDFRVLYIDKMMMSLFCELFQ